MKTTITALKFVASLAIAAFAFIQMGCRTHDAISFAGFEPASANRLALNDQIAGSNPAPSTTHQSALSTLKPNQDLTKLVNEAPGVVLVDFYADWCGPCKKQGKILAGMEESALKHQARIIKVNVDNHPELAKKFQVAALPTLLLFKDGKIIGKQLGLADRSRITSLLKR